jgi:hypothetical protein
MNYVIRHAKLLLCLVVVAGCRSAQEPASAPVAVRAAPVITPVVNPALVKASSPAARTPDVANPKITSAHVAEFKPPFPERNELFEAPKRKSTVRRDDEHGQSVELKGFMNVDQPRVILSIDGVISPIPEGGEKYGVKVISIQPPNALLQRGRSRWTATLE